MAISYISSATAEATTLTMPSHQAGDVLIMFAFRDGSTTQGTMPGGWTQISAAAANTCAGRLAYKIATSGSETSGTWTSYNELVCHVYRGASGPGASTSGTGSSATVNYPALTLNNSSNGTSWVAGFGGHRSTNGDMGTAPTGMTNRSNRAGSTADAAGHDTNGEVSSWSSQNVSSGETASGYITFVVEIYPELYIENIDKSNVSVPSGVSGAYVTLIGGGASGGGGATRGGTGSGNGGGGGGGGGYIKRAFVPASDLGSTYSVTRGASVAGVGQGTTGNNGNASSFTTGSVTLTASGGSGGASATTPTGGSGGGTSLSGGISAETTETGASGGAGSTTQGVAGTIGGASTHAGAGGGGGGVNKTTASNGGDGGDSSTADGTGNHGVANNGAGSAGPDGSYQEGGAGGGGGAGGSGLGNSGGNGGAGGNAGAGGGGGGGKEGSSGSGGTSGAGAAGYTLVEWTFPEKIETLTDNFSSLDTTNTWDTSGTCSSTSGQLNLTNTSSGSYITTKDLYDLTGSSVYIQMIQVPAAGEKNTMLRFFDSSFNEYVEIGCDNSGSFTCREYNGSSFVNATYISQDLFSQQYIRLRESGGTVYFETSPDANTWYQRNSLSPSGDYSIGYLQILTSRWGSGSDGDVVIFDNLNLAGPTPKAATLTDDFAGIDSGKWDTLAGSPNTWVGHLILDCATSYPRISTTVPVDCTSSNSFILVSGPPNIGSTNTSNVALCLQTAQGDGSNAVNFVIGYASGGSLQLLMQERVASVNDQTTLTYDMTAHRYLRIREASGTTYWDTSPDGSTWTNRRSKSSGITMSSVYVTIQAGIDSSDSTAGSVSIDNIGITKSAGSKLDTFTETFDTFDSSKWDLSGSASFTGGRLSLPCDNTYGNYILSDDVYDLNKSYIYFKIIQPPNVGNGTTGVFYRLGPGSGWDNYCLQGGWVNGNIYFEKRLSDVSTTIVSNTSYDPYNHRYLRIRGSQTTVYFDVSKDGKAWTSLGNDTFPFPVDRLHVSFISGYWGTEPSPGTALLDNINTVNDKAHTLQDSFSTKDTAKWDWFGTADVSGGHAVMTPDTGWSNTVRSVLEYDLVDSEVVGNLAQVPNNTGSTGSDYTATGISLRSYADTTNNDDWEEFSFYAYGTGTKTVYFAESIDTTWDGGWTSTNYDATAHKWWRIRESGGTVYWETSSDALAWTTRRSKSVGNLDVTGLKIWIATGGGGTIPSPGTAEWDSINIYPTLAIKDDFTSLLTDDFSSQDTNKWTFNGSASVSGGELSLPVASNYGNFVNSVGTFDLTGGVVVAQLTQDPNVGNSSTEVFMYAESTANGDQVMLGLSGGGFFTEERLGGVIMPSTTVSTTDRWFRIGEYQGNTYWDTSADGITWTNRRYKASAVSWKSMKVTLMSGYWDTESSPGTAKFDNVNVYTANNWTLTSDANISAGQITLQCPSPVYSQAYSTRALDLSSSFVTVQLIQRANVGNGSTQSILSLRSVADDTDLEEMYVSGSNLVFRERIDGSDSDTSVTFNATDHAYWRIRMSGTTVLWETSPDQISWTTQRSKTIGAIDYTNLRVHLMSGYWDTESSPGTTIFDNLNINPNTSLLTDDFGSQDNIKWDYFGNAAVSSNQLSLPIITGAGPGGSTSGINSRGRYDLTGGSIMARLVQLPNIGNGSVETSLQIRSIAAEDALELLWSNGSIYFRQAINGTNDQTSATYNATSDKWFRIRESGGTVYWDTSFDGSVWSNRRSLALGEFDITNTMIVVHAYYYDTETTPGTAIWDNVNITSATAVNNFLPFF